MLRSVKECLANRALPWSVVPLFDKKKRFNFLLLNL